MQTFNHVNYWTNNPDFSQTYHFDIARYSSLTEAISKMFAIAEKDSMHSFKVEEFPAMTIYCATNGISVVQVLVSYFRRTNPNWQSKMNNKNSLPWQVSKNVAPWQSKNPGKFAIMQHYYISRILS